VKSMLKRGLDRQPLPASAPGLGAGQNMESTFILHPFPSIPAFLV